MKLFLWNTMNILYITSKSSIITSKKNNYRDYGRNKKTQQKTTLKSLQKFIQTKDFHWKGCIENNNLNIYFSFISTEQIKQKINWNWRVLLQCCIIIKRKNSSNNTNNVFMNIFIKRILLLFDFPVFFHLYLCNIYVWKYYWFCLVFRKY